LSGGVFVRKRPRLFDSRGDKHRRMDGYRRLCDFAHSRELPAVADELAWLVDSRYLYVFEFLAGLFSAHPPIFHWDLVDYDFNRFRRDAHFGEDLSYTCYHLLLSLV